MCTAEAQNLGMCAEMELTSTIKDELTQGTQLRVKQNPGNKYLETINRLSSFPLPIPQICTEPFCRPNTVFWAGHGRAGQGLPFSSEPEGQESVPWSSWAIQESSSHQPEKSLLMTDGGTEFKGVYTYMGSPPLEREGDSDPCCNTGEPRGRCANRNKPPT